MQGKSQLDTDHAGFGQKDLCHLHEVQHELSHECELKQIPKLKLFLSSLLESWLLHFGYSSQANMPGKATESGPSTWIPDGIPGSCPWPGPALGCCCHMETEAVDEDVSRSISLCLSSTLFKSLKQRRYRDMESVIEERRGGETNTEDK